VARPGSLGTATTEVSHCLDDQAELDWHEAFLDGSFVPAKKGTRISPTAGKVKGAPYPGDGREWTALGIPVTAANVPEVTVGLEVLDQVKVPRPQGRPRQRPASLAADKSYDSADFRWELRRRGISHSYLRGRAEPSSAGATSVGISGQPESLEGGVESRVVRQLAEIGNQV
jgi:hypothetical protein